jgi:hypothetical protein
VEILVGVTVLVGVEVFVNVAVRVEVGELVTVDDNVNVRKAIGVLDSKFLPINMNIALQITIASKRITRKIRLPFKRAGFPRDGGLICGGTSFS